jgi:hypothetical protein
MDFLCPECMGSLESSDGTMAKCALHGGEFKILFARSPFRMPAGAASASQLVLAPATKCRWHPSMDAVGLCADCGAGVCGVCSFSLEPAGGHLCPLCAQRRASGGAPPVLQAPTPAEPEVPAGARCRQHPDVEATSKCKLCGTFLCKTCVFEIPGGFKLCPACATAPRSALSHKRKILLIGSFVAAAWCSLVLGALMGGFFRDMARQKEGQQMLGTLLMFILIIPSIIGVALGCSAMERRMTNTMAIWIATIWNSIILGSFILLMIYGLAKR